MNGRLAVVGIGIKYLQHITAECMREIGQAEKVFALVSDPLSILWLRKKHQGVVILNKHYSEDRERKTSYLLMVEEVIAEVSKGHRVCVVSYGHPGVFAFPLHEAVRRACDLGIEAVMLPGISAEDCLFADLGVDPGSDGCLSFEATDFLLHRRPVDTHCHLILWQIGVIGIRKYKNDHTVWNLEGVGILADQLKKHYPADHGVIIYEAAIYPETHPKKIRTCIRNLPIEEITPISTLYVPLVSRALPDTNMIRILGLV